jgi:hypothetical protein
MVSRFLPDVLAGPRGRSAICLAIAYWSATNWYVNAATGNDANDGQSAITALRTTEELSRRLAIPIPIDHPVTVHIAQGSYGTLAVRVIQSALACPFDVVGEVSYTNIGTVTSYTDRIAATNTAAHLMASGVADWTAHVGKRVDVRDGAQAGAVAWVAKANPHAAGVGTARVTRFALRSGENVAPTAKVPTSGSALSLATLPQISAVSIQTVGLQPGDAQFSSRHGRIVGLAAGAISLSGNGPLFVEGCSFSSLVFGRVYTESNQVVMTSALLPARTYPEIGDAVYSYVLILAGSATAVTLRGNCNLQNCLVQAVPLVLLSGYLAGVAVFDCAGSAIELLRTEAGRAYISGAFGRDNLYGLTVPTNSVTTYGTANTVTGSSGSLAIPSSVSAIPWTALPWVDGERSGEATLVGGTVDVTVPYVLATQKIQASAKTFGGTPGFLRAAYVNATTIRITSSSATDTSVVTWHILPVGDNAVIRS